MFGYVLLKHLEHVYEWDEGRPHLPGPVTILRD